MPEARSVSVILRAITGQYQAAMAKAKATMSEFGAASQKAGTNWTAMGKKTQSVGREISRVGTTLTRNVSLPLGLLGAGAVKTAIDFETAFTGVRKTIDATEVQYRQLERGIQDMAERLPASVEEISAVAEAAGQLGIQRENILGFTEVMIGLGETTNLTADQAATALARFANITQMSQKDFDKLSSTIVDLGNKGASTEAEITEMSLRIAGAGKQVGMSEAQILGFAESLSSVGINAEAGGSAISRVFITMASEIEKGKKGLDDFAKVAGMTSDEFKTAFEEDAAGATIAFIEGLGKIKKEGGSVFKVLEDLGLNEIRVRDALLRASGAGDLFAESQKTAAEAWKENNALAKESEKRYKTTAAQLEILKNKFRNVLAKFGKDMMPVLKDAAEALSDLAKWFGSLSEEQRKNIIKWGAIAAVAGPVLKLFGGITTAIGTILRTGGAAATIVGKIVAGAAGGGAGAAGGAASAGGAAAGGMSALAAGGSILAGAGLAHLADTGIEALEKKIVPQGEGLGSELARAVSGGLRRGLSSLPGIGAFLQDHDATADLLKDNRTELEKIGDAFTNSAAANRRFSTVMARANGITGEQAAKIAALVDSAEQYAGGLNELQTRQIGNLLAMGDFKGAMDLIRGAMDEATGKAKKLGDGFDDAGADAEEAAIKADRFKASLDRIPNQKTVRITVYQDTISQKIIRRVTETGSGKLAPGEDPTVKPTRQPNFTSYSPSPSLAGDFTVSGVLEIPGIGPAILKGARITVDSADKRQGRMTRARSARVA